MGLGFKQAGFRLVGAWDFDKYAVMSYEHNISSKVKKDDITTMKWNDLPFAHVWTFGFPCQDISVAGKQAGMIKGETRSGLFYEVMRLLDETREYAAIALPRIILAENVKAVKKYLPEIEKEYNARGYRMIPQLYNSKYWGVPQNRERYFIIGILDEIEQDFVFPTEQKDFIPKLSSVLETNVDEKFYIDDEKAKKIIEQAMKRIELKSVHSCLTPNRTEKRQNGRRAKVEEEEMFTLTAQDLHGVILDDTYGFGGHRQLKILEELQTVFTTDDGVAYCCDANYAKGTSPGDIGKSRRTHIIVEVANETGLGHENGINRTLRVGGQGSLSKKHNYDHILEPTFRVRKLTPREYARLQGFPEEFKFVVSNTQLYKQFGNAVTVNVSRAIAEQINVFLSGVTKKGEYTSHTAT